MSILNILKKINARVQEEINREWANRHDWSEEEPTTTLSGLSDDSSTRDESSPNPWSIGETISTDGLHDSGGLTWSGD